MNNHPTTYRPTHAARHVERLDGETLVYEVSTDEVLRLAPDAAQVWDACSDGSEASTIAASTGLSPLRVDQSIAQLVAAHLLEPSDAPRMSRRQFSTRVGLGVAGVALVSSLAAPTPAAAASGGGGGGGGNNGGGGHNGGGNN